MMRNQYPRIPDDIREDDYEIGKFYLTKASFDQPKPEGPHYDGLVEPCRIVLATKNEKGYGIHQRQHEGSNQVRMCTKLVYAYVWDKTYDQITDTGLYLLHRCDVPACIRPSHLNLGTAKQNQNDMKRRKRAGRKPRKQS